MRPKAAQICRAYGLLKIRKPFQHLPKFRPIIDTINTPYHGIGKFLKSLLNPLAQNKYVVKDSFEAAAKINLILRGCISDEYTFVSSEVESLLQNVPLKKNIEIILNRVYSKKKFQQHLAKDSMRSPLGSLITNVIMTELELVVVKDLFNKGYLKFYI